MSSISMCPLSNIPITYDISKRHQKIRNSANHPHPWHRTTPSPHYIIVVNKHTPQSNFFSRESGVQASDY
ncbi:MAG: hypothetical protein GY694_00470 [Gammaproteobacteria bacterium]|nr:hypothetical protein [Gammaproteobacteria bacterium]